MIAKYFVSSLDASSDKEIIQKLGDILIKTGEVLPEYTAAVMKAEDNLATGIELNHVSIAIPHTNNDTLINNAAIAVGILKNSVSFGSMIVVSETTPVDIVFLLAIKGIDEQLAVIARLMKAFQNDEWLNRFYRASSDEIMREIFEEIGIDGNK